MHAQSNNYFLTCQYFFRICTKYTPSLVALLSASSALAGRAQEAARLGIYIIMNNHHHRHHHHTQYSSWHVFTLCVVGTTPARTPTSAIPGEHKSSCKPYLAASLQRGATIIPLLWPNVFKPLHNDFFPLRCSHCLPDCESTYYTSSVSATPLRRSQSLKVKRLISQNFSWKRPL